MNDVMLPWPRPRRSGQGKKGEGENAANTGRPESVAPRYEIQRVNADGSRGPVEIRPITRPPWEAKSGRRGFLGAGIASSVAAALLLSGCDDGDSGVSPSPWPGDSDSPSDSGSPSDPDDSIEPPDTEVPDTEPERTPTETYSPPDYDYDDPPSYGTTGGQICTCNKVCTCIPVCQAHQLLSPDPAVRKLAETVVIAMGPRELPYLRWARREAEGPLRERVGELIAEVCGGRRLAPGDLDDPGCGRLLDSGDPVVALMAAQVLTLRALLLGTGLGGDTGRRAAAALTAGNALHRGRAPAWSR